MIWSEPSPARPPAELVTHRDRGEHMVKVRVRGGYQDYVLDYHPLDVVGWDGYVYPYTFNADDFEPRAGRFHLPPPAHQTFQGPNFVICTFAPRMLDWDPMAVPIPYHHSNVQSEEMIYYVDGQFGSRKGVDIGAITLHPSGLPHGPQPGLVEKSLGATRTEELAVGDLVLTSGLDGVFPPGTPIGRIAAVDKRGQGLFQYATVEPAVDLDRLEEVLVARRSGRHAEAKDALPAGRDALPGSP